LPPVAARRGLVADSRPRREGFGLADHALAATGRRASRAQLAYSAHDQKARPDSTRRLRHKLLEVVYARPAIRADGRFWMLSLFKGDRRRIGCLADHLHAEYPVPVESQGRKVSEWQNRPNHPDNHFFDCLVGCCVGASMQGAALASEDDCEVD
jgi:hypothetical protein